ncbi:DUF2441 domain-containing protein [Paenibacillus lutimineralis]|uniref:DUF2441 domain-containing protein n=1 Tax=Paenibacillus lutimineralis TaxID=2707005 RepID=UPI001F2CA73D|nr:DUF2441 domain-containing protein [Paenibacillus lutimineralis]
MREVVFEEVRAEMFPDYPSRQRGLWVMPMDSKPFIYWWGNLGREGKLFSVKLTGKLHRANQDFLILNTRPLNVLRENAIKYWSGDGAQNSYQAEILFEGDVEVLEEINYTVDEKL